MNHLLSRNEPRTVFGHCSKHEAERYSLLQWNVMRYHRIMIYEMMSTSGRWPAASRARLIQSVWINRMSSYTLEV